MSPALVALCYGLLSALSMPVGAILGMACKPSHVVIAHLMAFGAGALVYAVSTELFGEALFKLKFARHEKHSCNEACQFEFVDMLVQSSCALVGAAAYVLLERLLQSISSPKKTSDEVGASYNELVQVTEEDKAQDDAESGANTAFAMWLGLLLDGIPESLTLGFMTKEGDLGFVLLISIFIANFPEAFSSAAILSAQQVSKMKIMGMWLSIFVITGLLTMLGCAILPDNVKVGSQAHLVKARSSAAAEGFTGGSMFAMIATAMLPEAFRYAGTKSGFSFVFGFIMAVTIAEFGVRIGGTEEFEG